MDDLGPPDASKSSSRTNLAKTGLAALAGLVVYFLALSLKSLMHMSVMAGQSPPVALFARFEFQFAGFVVFTCLAWLQRRRPDGWISAFLAGMGLPYVLLHWL
jgi:hypothetical protein